MVSKSCMPLYHTIIKLLIFLNVPTPESFHFHLVLSYNKSEKLFWWQQDSNSDRQREGLTTWPRPPPRPWRHETLKYNYLFTFQLQPPPLSRNQWPAPLSVRTWTSLTTCSRICPMPGTSLEEPISSDTKVQFFSKTDTGFRVSGK